SRPEHDRGHLLGLRARPLFPRARGPMRRVVIESPYAGDVERNVRYARACLLDSLRRGEAPIASHLLYPQVLDDADEEERALGIGVGLIWAKQADAAIFYCDLGFSPGMHQAARFYDLIGTETITRKIGGAW